MKTSRYCFNQQGTKLKAAKDDLEINHHPSNLKIQYLFRSNLALGPVYHNAHLNSRILPIWELSTNVKAFSPQALAINRMQHSLQY